MDNAKYHVEMDKSLYDELKQVAEKHGFSPLDAIKKAIKLFLLVHYLSEREDASIFIQEGDHKQKLTL